MMKNLPGFIPITNRIQWTLEESLLYCHELGIQVVAHVKLDGRNYLRVYLETYDATDETPSGGESFFHIPVTDKELNDFGTGLVSLRDLELAQPHFLLALEDWGDCTKDSWGYIPASSLPEDVWALEGSTGNFWPKHYDES